MHTQTNYAMPHIQGCIHMDVCTPTLAVMRNDEQYKFYSLFMFIYKQTLPCIIHIVHCVSCTPIHIKQTPNIQIHVYFTHTMIHVWCTRPTCIHTHTHTRTNILYTTLTHTTQTYTHTHTHTYIHKHTHTHTFIHAHTHTHIHTYTHRHRHTHTHTHTHTHSKRNKPNNLFRNV